MHSSGAELKLELLIFKREKELASVKSDGSGTALS